MHPLYEKADRLSSEAQVGAIDRNRPGGSGEPPLPRRWKAWPLLRRRK
jgi:hypothetical protein